MVIKSNIIFILVLFTISSFTMTESVTLRGNLEFNPVIDNCDDIGPNNCKSDEEWDQLVGQCIPKCSKIEGLKWNNTEKKCDLLCSNADEIYSPTLDKCIPMCEEGTKNKNGVCVSICKDSEKWNKDKKTCESKCEKGTVWLEQIAECIIPRVCPEGLVFGVKTSTCISMCCKTKGFYYSPDEKVCKKIECPTGEYWNGFRCSKMTITGKCDEDKFYNFKRGNCDDKCNAKSGQIWCKTTKRCIYRCQKINQLWDDEKKECQETTINTTLCTPGNFFDSSKKTCRKLCSVNKGMYFNPQTNNCMDLCIEPKVFNNILKQCIDPISIPYTKCEKNQSFNYIKAICEDNCNAEIGTSYSSIKGCEAKCAGDQFYDSSNNKCIEAKINCADGLFWYGYLNICVDACFASYKHNNKEICHQICKKEQKFNKKTKKCEGSLNTTTPTTTSPTTTSPTTTSPTTTSPTTTSPTTTTPTTTSPTTTTPTTTTPTSRTTTTPTATTPTATTPTATTPTATTPTATTPNIDCAPNKMNVFGKCEVVKIFECPRNYIKDNTICTSIENPKQKICVRGYIKNGENCQINNKIEKTFCPKGYLEKDSVCVPPEFICPRGTVRSKNTCKQKNTLYCPENYRLDRFSCFVHFCPAQWNILTVEIKCIEYTLFSNNSILVELDSKWDNASKISNLRSIK